MKYLIHKKVSKIISSLSVLRLRKKKMFRRIPYFLPCNRGEYKRGLKFVYFLLINNIYMPHVIINSVVN